MSKKILVVLILFFMNNNTCIAEVITTSSFEKLKGIFLTADEDTLIILDIDETLIVATDAALHPKKRNFIKKQIAASAGGHDQPSHLLWSIIQKEHHPKLIDKEMPLIIKKLQRNGALVLACTSFPIGSWGIISNIEQWRSNQLMKLGIELSILKTVNMKQFQSIGDIGFYKGIIFAGEYDKGTVIETFLQATKLSIKRIIFVDDRMNQVKSVESFANKAGLKYFGIEYTAVAQRPTAKFNLTRARKQFAMLINNHRWLSDHEADLRIDLATIKRAD